MGIDSARASDANFITGFTRLRFTINDLFDRNEKLLKYWNFKGKHTGAFFGMPSTGNSLFTLHRNHDERTGF